MSEKILLSLSLLIFTACHSADEELPKASTLSTDDKHAIESVFYKGLVTFKLEPFVEAAKENKSLKTIIENKLKLSEDQYNDIFEENGIFLENVHKLIDKFVDDVPILERTRGHQSKMAKTCVEQFLEICEEISQGNNIKGD